MSTPSVLILADDLIWSTRLVDLVTRAGGTPQPVRDLGQLGPLLDAPNRFVIVDLTARAYNGIAAVEMAAYVNARILCVGQHDDRELRERAMRAGAHRVLPYRTLFEKGEPLLQQWLEEAPETLPTASGGAA